MSSLLFCLNLPQTVLLNICSEHTSVSTDNRLAAAVCGIPNALCVNTKLQGCVCAGDWQVLRELEASYGAVHETYEE